MNKKQEAVFLFYKWIIKTRKNDALCYAVQVCDAPIVRLCFIAEYKKLFIKKLPINHHFVN